MTERLLGVTGVVSVWSVDPLGFVTSFGPIECTYRRRTHFSFFRVVIDRGIE